MKILAIDTSANTATVAITEDTRLLAECVVNYKKTHSETLMPMVDEVLKKSGTDISEIDIFAVANGPGSFTGLRIGVSTVKGMAHALNKPIVEICTLEAMAHNVFMCEDIICPIMDARRSQVYNALYTWENGILKELTPPRALSVEECIEDLKGYDKRVVFVGDGVPVHRDFIIGEMGDKAVFAPASCNEQRASSVAALAYDRSELAKPSYAVKPLYLRKPQAERELEEKEMYKFLFSPKGKVDAVIDTDAYNEIDDQFAISYMLKSDERINTKAIYAAPFLNARSTSPADGMEKSYNEILNLLDLMGKPELSSIVYKGSEKYLPDEKTPVVSPAAEDLAKRAMSYSKDNPLYVLSIGAITNIASALLLNPDIAERIVIVWLGGSARDYKDTKEFNMFQDIAAARVVMSAKTNFVQLPCQGVVSEFAFSKREIERSFSGNPLADYLSSNAIRYMSDDSFTFEKKVIWDVTAVAWLMNDNNRFMQQRIEETLLPDYEGYYEQKPCGNHMAYIYKIRKDELLEDLAKVINK